MKMHMYSVRHSEAKEEEAGCLVDPRWKLPIREEMGPDYPIKQPPASL